jgi:hypothetical protein
VKCNDPWVIKRFHQDYKNFAFYHDLGRKSFQTEADSSYPPTYQALEQADIVGELQYYALHTGVHVPFVKNFPLPGFAQPAKKHKKLGRGRN